MRLFKFLTLALAVLACLALPAGAQAKRELKIEADRMDYDETRKQVRLVGHVRFQSGDTVMTAPYAEYHTGRQIAEFQGGVKITQPGSTLVGNKMKVWYGEGRGVLSGNVRLVSEKAPGGEARTPGVMTANEIEYRWVEGIGEARGAVKVRQGDRRAFSDLAHYDRNTGTIDLTGNVRFEQGQDDWLTSDSAQVNLEKETIVAKGQVVGRFMIDEEESTRTEEPATPRTLPPTEAVEPEIPVESVEAAPPVLLPGLED